jgi:hypothetical protein
MSIIIKICKKCNISKPITFFYKKKSGKYGVDGQCKECVNLRNAKWAQENREKSNQIKRKWAINNPELKAQICREYARKHHEQNKPYRKMYDSLNREKINQKVRDWNKNNKEKVAITRKNWRKNNPEKYKLSKQKWYIKNREKINKQASIKQKTKLRSDIKFNLNARMKASVRLALKGTKKGRKWEDLVGYAVIDLKKHLEKTMPKNFTWEDYLQGKLHIDHKIPISVFNFEKPEDIDFKKCWALKNLQLLPRLDNLKKGATINQPFQPSLIFK